MPCIHLQIDHHLGVLHETLTGYATTPDGKGHWVAAADGGEFAYAAATGKLTRLVP